MVPSSPADRGTVHDQHSSGGLQVRRRLGWQKRARPAGIEPATIGLEAGRSLLTDWSPDLGHSRGRWLPTANFRAYSGRSQPGVAGIVDPLIGDLATGGSVATAVPGVDDHIAEVDVIDVAADHDGVSPLASRSADPCLQGAMDARLRSGGTVLEWISGGVAGDVAEASRRATAAQRG